MQENETKPRRIEGLIGLVIRAPFAVGSKSKREAIWLEVSDGPLILRRKGGPAFGDHCLDKFVGKQVSCDGWILGYTILAERIDLLG